MYMHGYDIEKVEIKKDPSKKCERHVEGQYQETRDGKEVYCKECGEYMYFRPDPML